MKLTLIYVKFQNTLKNFKAYDVPIEYVDESNCTITNIESIEV